MKFVYTLTIIIPDDTIPPMPRHVEAALDVGIEGAPEDLPGLSRVESVEVEGPFAYAEDVLRDLQQKHQTRR